MTSKPDFEALFNASPYPYVLLAPDMTIIGANTAYLHITAAKAEDIVGRHAFDAFPPNPGDPDSTNMVEVQASVRHAIATRQPHSTPLVRYALKRDTPDGPVFEERYWSVLHTPVLDASGEVTCIAQNTIDITDLYAANKPSLRNGERFKDFNHAQMYEAVARMLSDERSHLRSLFNQAPGFVAIQTGKRHVFEMANESYLQLVGHRDIIGKPLLEALPEIAGQGFDRLLDEVFETGQSYIGHGVRVTVQRERSGTLSDIYLDFVYQPILDGDGKVNAIFVQGQDVTEAHQAEVARQLADEWLREGMELARMTVWDWNLVSGKITYSDNAASVFGCSWENIEEVWGSVHPDDIDAVDNNIRKAIEEKSGYSVINRLVRQDTGEIIWLNSRGRVLCDTTGTPSIMRGISLDITERKRAETELERVNRMLSEQVRQLAEAKKRHCHINAAEIKKGLVDRYSPCGGRILGGSSNVMPLSKASGELLAMPNGTELFTVDGEMLTDRPEA